MEKSAASKMDAKRVRLCGRRRRKECVGKRKYSDLGYIGAVYSSRIIFTFVFRKQNIVVICL